MRAKIALTSTANKLNFSFCISCAIFHVSWSCCLATYSSIPPKNVSINPQHVHSFVGVYHILLIIEGTVLWISERATSGLHGSVDFVA